MKVESLRPGDVLIIFDRLTRPPKQKLHLCICEASSFFLRINSGPRWKPNLPLRAAENDFLHHDSYLELRSLLHHPRADVEAAQHIGCLTDAMARRVVEAAERADTLPPGHKRLIREKLLD